MAGLIQSNLLMFDDKNYGDWCVKMDAILGFHEVDEIMKRGFKEPSKGYSEEMQKIYRENKSSIAKRECFFISVPPRQYFKKFQESQRPRKLGIYCKMGMEILEG